MTKEQAEVILSANYDAFPDHVRSQAAGVMSQLQEEMYSRQNNKSLLQLQTLNDSLKGK